MDTKFQPLNSISPSPAVKLYKLLGFVGILRECQKLIFRTGKVVFSITIHITVLSSIILVMNIFSIKPSITDFATKARSLIITDSTSPEFSDLLITLKNDLRVAAGLEGIFMLAFSFTSLFFATESILASGVSYCGKDLAVKELLSMVMKSLKRPFVTWFYTTLLRLGYCVFVIAFLVPLVLLLNPEFTLSAFSIFVILVAVLFEAYLSVVWNLSLVVSVLEGKWGNEALGKAGQLINGSKLCGFFLNILSGTVSIFLMYSLKQIGTTSFPGNKIVIPLLLVNSLSLIRIFTLMAYTILYYKSKEIHGEELEMQGSMEYTKLMAVTPLIGSDEV